MRSMHVMDASQRPLRPGTPVRLDDGSVACATYDPRDGTYRTAQRNPVTGGIRYDYGWRREQLVVL